ncbi:MAG: tetratricopeptide repeat protein [Aliidongia sp.]
MTLKPDHANAWSNLGNILTTLRRFEEAESCYREVLRFGSNMPATHSNLGNALRDRGRFDEAEA